MIINNIKDQRYINARHLIRNRVLTQLLKIGHTLVPIPSSGIVVDFEFLTGSSWEELWSIAIEYPYQKYLNKVLRLFQE